MIEYQALTDLLGLNVLGQLSVFSSLWGETLRDARVGVEASSLETRVQASAAVDVRQRCGVDVVVDVVCRA